MLYERKEVFNYRSGRMLIISQFSFPMCFVCSILQDYSTEYNVINFGTSNDGYFPDNVFR